MASKVEKEAEPIPSVKDLASSEPSLRRKNLQQIVSHLELRSISNHLTHTQALQLWKGFSVALYMHDSKNQLSVQTLIATLANTFKVVRSKDLEFEIESRISSSSAKDDTTSNKPTNGTNGILNSEEEFTGFDDEHEKPSETSSTNPSWSEVYTTAFWETIAREWSGIDQWRINKYLLLIRFVLREIFSISLSSSFGIEEIPRDTRNDEAAQAEPIEQATEPTTKKRKSQPSNESKSTTSAKKTKPNNPSPPNPTNSSHTPISNPQVLSTQLSILSTHPLSPRSRQTSDGLRLHLLDIYLDELSTAFYALKPRLNFPTDTLTTVLKQFDRPIRQVATDALARHVRTKAKEVLGEMDAKIKEMVVEA